jgi:hypothetical protein
LYNFHKHTRVLFSFPWFSQKPNWEKWNASNQLCPIMTDWPSCATLYSFRQSKTTRTIKPKTPFPFSFYFVNFLSNRTKKGKNTHAHTDTDTGSEREVLPERCRSESLCVRAWCLSREGGEPRKLLLIILERQRNCKCLVGGIRCIYIGEGRSVGCDSIIKDDR